MQANAAPPTYQGVPRSGVAPPVHPGEELAVVETVSVAEPAVVPLMVTGLVVPKLNVGGTTAFAGLVVMAAVSTTLPVNPFAGVSVIVDVSPETAPAVTVTAVPAILKLGGKLIVYVALVTALVVKPVAVAIASIVSVAEIVIGPLYTVELVVGAVPLVV
jgi:hypothetical protein